MAANGPIAGASPAATRGGDAGVPHLVLYARAYCHLCGEMSDALVAMQQAHRFTFETVDVDADQALVERYDELVPVLVHEGREVCHYVLDRDALVACVAEVRGPGEPKSPGSGASSPSF